MFERRSERLLKKNINTLSKELKTEFEVRIVRSRYDDSIEIKTSNQRFGVIMQFNASDCIQCIGIDIACDNCLNPSIFFDGFQGL